MVEYRLAKARVASSNLVSRFTRIGFEYIKTDFFVYQNNLLTKEQEISRVLLCGFFDYDMIEKENRKGRRIWKKE